MVRKTYTIELRKQAENLRRSGRSYKEIYDKLQVPKSTLSTWFGSTYPGIFNREKQLKHLARIRIKALATNKKKKDQERFKLEKRVGYEIKSYPTRNIGFLKSVLSALYWAEGSKSHRSPVVFTNTDPRLVRLFLTLLRKCYCIDEKKLRVRLHLHYYHPITKTKKYWSKLLNIPAKSFGKIYIKKRSLTKKFRKNFMGICFIKYYDNMLQKEIMALAYQISDKITMSSSSNG